MATGVALLQRRAKGANTQFSFLLKQRSPRRSARPRTGAWPCTPGTTDDGRNTHAHAHGHAHHVCVRRRRGWHMLNTGGKKGAIKAHKVGTRYQALPSGLTADPLAREQSFRAEPSPFKHQPTCKTRAPYTWKFPGKSTKVRDTKRTKSSHPDTSGSTEPRPKDEPRSIASTCRCPHIVQKEGRIEHIVRKDEGEGGWREKEREATV